MTRTPGASSSAPQYDVDNLSLAIQKLELAVIRSLESMEVRMKGLESRIDNFQSYYGDLEMKRNADVSTLVNSVVGITNNLTGLLNDIVLQRHVVGPVVQATKQELPAPTMVAPAMPMYRPPVQVPQPQTIFPQTIPQQLTQPILPAAVPKPVQQVVQSPVFPGVPAVSAPAPVAAQVVTPKKEEKPVLGFGDKFAKKPGEWDCQGCYNRNQADHEKCPSCGTTKDGKQPVVPESKPLISKLPEPKPTAQPISFGFQAPKTTTVTPTTPATTAAAVTTTTPASTVNFSFKPPVTKTETPTVAPLFGQTTSPFASKTATPTTGATSMFGGGIKSGGTTTTPLFGGSKLFSQNAGGANFGSLVNQPSFLNKSAQDASDTVGDSFGAKSSSTFKKEDGEGNDGESPEEFVPDAHFEPVVPLPDKIDVVTGEEQERTVFESRAKLYAYADKAVKERGTGVLKILHDPEKRAYRCVMRRDQVFKICANFKIYPNMTVEDKPGRDNVGLFHCVDFSEDSSNGANTVFLIKFDSGSEYNNFKQKFAESAKASGTDPGRVSSASDEAKSGSKGPSLPSISSPSQDDEAEDADYYEDEDYGAEDEEENRVVHESPCTVTFSDAYTSPMAKSAGKSETLKNVQFVVSTPDDDSFKVAFEKNEEEEHFPHYIDKTFTFTLTGKSLKYMARNEDTGTRKLITCEFPNADIAKKTLECLEECKNTTSYDGSDE
ncbi:hypothetical protein FO519_001586 [Halicephalobus sp. NKZ332]|nr:hypothetical protein FO519_001586 [Halicephalobus sp. NKZ332]